MPMHKPFALINIKGFPGGSVVKSLPGNAGDAGLIPGSGRPPGEGNGSPLQYSCLGNPMDREAWRATVAKSWTHLSDLNSNVSILSPTGTEVSVCHDDIKWDRNI